jgi:hypothetical protein
VPYGIRSADADADADAEADADTDTDADADADTNADANADKLVDQCIGDCKHEKGGLCTVFACNGADVVAKRSVVVVSH